jgi:Zn-dependent M28 family amino/carboxypeptidase
MKRILFILVLIFVFAFFYLRNPSLPSFETATSSVKFSSEALRKHVNALSAILPNRNYKNEASLQKAEDYIQNEFKKLGYEVRLQDVPADKKVFHNLIVRYGNAQAPEVVVIGAHYDVAGETNPGADDNASGVASLLEIARLLKEYKPATDLPIELVAYTLEEPPFFRTPFMGSVVHAQDLKQKGTRLKLMISLEMLGYYSDDWFSQSFPISALYAFYPWKGNFISVVASPSEREVTREFKQSMNDASAVSAYSINAPPALVGIDFSDHQSYWQQGWPALMVTDTAFYRNAEYHEAGDTPDRLNYDKMAEVTKGVFNALLVQAKSR